MDTAASSFLDHARRASLLAVAVAMPLWPDALPALLAVMTILLLPWRGSIYRALDLSSPLPWILLWYALHLLGMAWSSNVRHGWFDLEVKLLALLVPLLCLCTAEVWQRHRNAVLRCFTWANAITILFLILRAIWLFIAELRWRATGEYPDGLPYTNIFYSSYFSPWLHPSYLAMYAVFALAASISSPPTPNTPRWSRIIEGGVLPLILAVGVVLLASKAGWIALAGLGALGIRQRWKVASARRSLVVGVLFIAVFFGILVGTMGAMRGKITEAWAAMQDDQETAHDNSSAARRLVWRSAFLLIPEHPWIGTGTGDVKDELVRTYADKGYAYPLEKRLNAHSQFLQTAVALGIPAAMILAASLLVPLLFAWQRRNQLLAFFLVLNAINWAVESMLEVQAGVVFFVFFAALLTSTPSIRRAA